MEDIFKFLLVIGVIVIGFVRQAKKGAKKRDGGTPVMPMPDEETAFPESREDETYGGYIPEGPKPEVIITAKKTEKKRKSAGISSNHFSPPTPAPQETNEQSEFEIHSVEEARRAIIWSEILQRKY